MQSLKRRECCSNSARSMALKSSQKPTAAETWGTRFFFLLIRLPLMILTLPVHAIPVLGTIAWLLANGWLYAWELEAEFMVMSEKRHRCGQQWQYVQQRFRAFAGFGSVAMALELIPFLGPWLFFASNACGAALLAEQIFRESHTFDGTAWHRKTDSFSNTDSSDTTCEQQIGTAYC
ncbi:unnamed protein product [Polarella glacialis]|uniref:Uncharacterized protein n=1 Tax=Polarella glacialis TaxID=89957 RepID=A0A813H8F8_POLGL|nr:unnamed protein product [Polarella glacialis]